MHVHRLRSLSLAIAAVLVPALGACRFDPSGASPVDDVPDAPDAGQIADASAPGRPDAAPAPGPDAAPLPPLRHAAVWLSTADATQQLARQPDLALGAGGAAPVILVDEAAVYQEMQGFGATLTESAAWLIATRLGPEQRRDLLERLFDRERGIGLGVLRLPIGANDFALGNYSYDDTAPALGDFSIDRDRQWMIPVLKEIRDVNPGLVRIAAPWSPPGWMKTTSSMIGGSLRANRRGTLAEYLVRYLVAYADEGLPITAISVQNEPYNLPTASPGMHMQPEEQASIVAGELGPRLVARGLPTRVLVWDHNWDAYDYARTVLASPAARPYVAGTAFHCYAGDPTAQSIVHDEHPELEIWLTECSSGVWEESYARSLRTNAQLLIGATRHWARAVLKWNLALDEQRGPQNHGCWECTGTVEVRQLDGAVTFQAEYFALGHLSKALAPGARRVGSESAGGLWIEHVAFANPDGQVVVVAFNPAEQATAFEVRAAAGTLAYTLPAGALATFVLPAP